MAELLGKHGRLKDLRSRFIVDFAGEDGEDQGGLSNALYTCVFATCINRRVV